MKIKKEKEKRSASRKGVKYKEESMLNGIKHPTEKLWMKANGQVESKQQDKKFTRKRREKGNTDLPEAKKKRVSFAADLERMKVFDKKKRLTISPSTASPGRSIIMKKEDGSENSPSLFVTPNSRGKVLGRENMLTRLTMREAHNEATKTEKPKQEASMDSTVKLAIPISKRKETKKSRKRQVQKISGGKIRPVSGRRKLEVTRKVKQKLLSMPKKERKMYIRELRKKHKPHFDLVLQCKHLWEKLRCGKTNETERKKVATEIFGIVEGKVKELIFAHDACRVVECMVTNGGSDVRNALFEELVSEIISMAKSKYARFFVIKMLKHGSVTQRQAIFDAFRGHCVSLLRVSSAAQVLESAYNDYANAQQRYNIIIEFFGVDFASFKAVDNRVRTLKEIIDDCPNRKSSVVKYLQSILIDIVDKPQIKLSLTHRLLSDFFEFADSKQLEEMIDSLKLCIPQIVHTSDGVRVAMKCLWNSSAKTRKIMLKNFKGLITKTCMEEFAHRFLIAVFDTVDDTVLIDRCLIKELLNNIGEIVKSNYGVKVMHHLIHPRDPRFCSASQVAIYKAGDGNPYSKKDSKIRYGELFSYIQKPFCNYFAANMDALLFESHASLLILDMLEAPTDLDFFDRKVSMEDRAACYDAIASLCSREFIPCDEGQLHPVEHPQAHFVISKLLKSDCKFDIKLGDFIVKRSRNQLSSWLACNKGCFILLHLLENASPQTQELVRNTLSLATVERYHTKGAVVLKQKLK
ncbi:pumilio domain-containing protein 12 [Loa loa]|uniref:Pumilio domain-containing protein 12 n=1 Tax=Loa loa TaxID=7209 RepID=A0A1I7VBX5_LOALO|nr:pumilio domain-containing protein 12 [Loa loa]EJD75872.1 pumilio domain-containing protein 12 [Loa loa]